MALQSLIYPVSGDKALPLLEVVDLDAVNRFRLQILGPKPPDSTQSEEPVLLTLLPEMFEFIPMEQERTKCLHFERVRLFLSETFDN